MSWFKWLRPPAKKADPPVTPPPRPKPRNELYVAREKPPFSGNPLEIPDLRGVTTRPAKFVLELDSDLSGNAALLLWQGTLWLISHKLARQYDLEGRLLQEIPFPWWEKKLQWFAVDDARMFVWGEQFRGLWIPPDGLFPIRGVEKWLEDKHVLTVGWVGEDCVLLCYKTWDDESSRCEEQIILTLDLDSRTVRYPDDLTYGGRIKWVTTGTHSMEVNVLIGHGSQESDFAWRSPDFLSCPLFLDTGSLRYTDPRSHCLSFGQPYRGSKLPVRPDWLPIVACRLWAYPVLVPDQVVPTSWRMSGQLTDGRAMALLCGEDKLRVVYWEDSELRPVTCCGHPVRMRETTCRWCDQALPDTGIQEA